MSNGFAVFVSPLYPGTKSDLAICRDLANNHRKCMAKSLKYKKTVDEDKEAFSYGEIFDKGYLGISNVLRNVIPKKKLPGRELSISEK